MYSSLHSVDPYSKLFMTSRFQPFKQHLKEYLPEQTQRFCTNYPFFQEKTLLSSKDRNFVNSIFYQKKFYENNFKNVLDAFSNSSNNLSIDTLYQNENLFSEQKTSQQAPLYDIYPSNYKSHLRYSDLKGSKDSLSSFLFPKNSSTKFQNFHFSYKNKKNSEVNEKSFENENGPAIYQPYNASNHQSNVEKNLTANPSLIDFTNFAKTVKNETNLKCNYTFNLCNQEKSLVTFYKNMIASQYHFAKIFPFHYPTDQLYFPFSNNLPFSQILKNIKNISDLNPIN